MDEQAMLHEQVRKWKKAKCKLFRTIPGWISATKRVPRDGDYAVPTTAGL